LKKTNTTRDYKNNRKYKTLKQTTTNKKQKQKIYIKKLKTLNQKNTKNIKNKNKKKKKEPYYFFPFNSLGKTHPSNPK
jgi:hypothetical protein